MPVREILFTTDSPLLKLRVLFIHRGSSKGDVESIATPNS